MSKVTRRDIRKQKAKPLCFGCNTYQTPYGVINTEPANYWREDWHFLCSKCYTLALLDGKDCEKVSQVEIYSKHSKGEKIIFNFIFTVRKGNTKRRLNTSCEGVFDNPT